MLCNTPFISYFGLFEGLQALRKQSDTRRQNLQLTLSQNKPISAEDKQWLDGEANLTDEALLLDKLADASDFSKALKDLTLAEKTITEKLQRAALAANRTSAN